MYCLNCFPILFFLPCLSGFFFLCINIYSHSTSERSGSLLHVRQLCKILQPVDSSDALLTQKLSFLYSFAWMKLGMSVHKFIHTKSTDEFWMKTLQRYRSKTFPRFWQGAIILKNNSLSICLTMNKCVYDALANPENRPLFPLYPEIILQDMQEILFARWLVCILVVVNNAVIDV